VIRGSSNWLRIPKRRNNKSAYFSPFMRFTVFPFSLALVQSGQSFVIEGMILSHRGNLFDGFLVGSLRLDVNEAKAVAS